MPLELGSGICLPSALVAPLRDAHPLFRRSITQSRKGRRGILAKAHKAHIESPSSALASGGKKMVVKKSAARLSQPLAPPAFATLTLAPFSPPPSLDEGPAIALQSERGQ